MKKIKELTDEELVKLNKKCNESAPKNLKLGATFAWVAMLLIAPIPVFIKYIIGTISISGTVGLFSAYIYNCIQYMITTKEIMKRDIDGDTIKNLYEEKNQGDFIEKCPTFENISTEYAIAIDNYMINNSKQNKSSKKDNKR